MPNADLQTGSPSISLVRLAIATFLGWTIPQTIYRWIQTQTGGFSLPFLSNDLVSIALELFLTAAVLVGLFLSLAQWFALKSILQSVWGWVVGQMVIWGLGNVLNLLLVLLTANLMMVNDAIAVLAMITLESLLTAIGIGVLTGLLTQKRTRVSRWLGLGAFSGVFCADFISKANLNLNFMDQTLAVISSGLLLAVFATLPALLIRLTTRSK